MIVRTRKWPRNGEAGRSWAFPRGVAYVQRQAAGLRTPVRWATIFVLTLLAVVLVVPLGFYETIPVAGKMPGQSRPPHGTPALAPRGAAKAPTFEGNAIQDGSLKDRVR